MLSIRSGTSEYRVGNRLHRRWIDDTRSSAFATTLCRSVRMVVALSQDGRIALAYGAMVVPLLSKRYCHSSHVGRAVASPRHTSPPLLPSSPPCSYSSHARSSSFLFTFTHTACKPFSAALCLPSPFMHLEHPCKPNPLAAHSFCFPYSGFQSELSVV